MRVGRWFYVNDGKYSTSWLNHWKIQMTITQDGTYGGRLDKYVTMDRPPWSTFLVMRQFWIAFRIRTQHARTDFAVTAALQRILTGHHRQGASLSMLNFLILTTRTRARTETAGETLHNDGGLRHGRQFHFYAFEQGVHVKFVNSQIFFRPHHANSTKNTTTKMKHQHTHLHSFTPQRQSKVEIITTLLLYCNNEYSNEYMQNIRVHGYSDNGGRWQRFVAFADDYLI